jgi:hypothetical protein
MPKQKISEFSSTPANNTDIDSINLAEGCAPSGINDAIRELMAQLKDWQSGTSNDPMVIGTTGSLTLNQGTANGVPYLNGSKVVTSGTALTFDGSNLGVGMTATAIAANYATLQLGGSVGGGIKLGTSSASAGYVAGTAGGIEIGTTGATSLSLFTNNATRATLDSSGNLGLGVTPSAWSSDTKAIQISSVSLSSTGNSAQYMQNGYYNAGYKYIGTGNAVLYEQNKFNGSHNWYTAASGTAGNAITFTQAMTLDASGRLGIGLTSPIDTLQVNGGITVGGDTSANDRSRFYESSGLVIDAGVTNARPILFRTQGSERARIESGGNLLVGTTGNASNARFKAVASGSNMVAQLQVGADGNYAIGFSNSAASTVGNITVNTSSTAYNTSSDYRLKNTIEPMTGALAKVALLKPCTYKWNADGSDGEGFIAHELAEVVPQCVTGSKDAVDEDGTPKYQGIDTSFLVATLTAALQELKAEFDAYKASHP